MIDNLKAHFKKRLDSIDCEPQILEAMEYTLISNGKMFRPLVFLCLCEKSKIDEITLMDICMSIECIHVYSLIHDDLPALDDDDLRRGIATCHKKFGEDIAILTGDALLTYSFELLSNIQIKSSSVVKLIRVLSSFSGVSGGMINGQVLDMVGRKDSILELEKIHLQKTGKLITVAFLFYSILNNLDDGEFEKLGMKIGLLYQMQDDYLDYYGELSVTGKKENSDLKNNKTTYVTLLGKNTLLSKIQIKQEEILLMFKQLELSQSSIAILNKIVKRV